MDRQKTLDILDLIDNVTLGLGEVSFEVPTGEIAEPVEEPEEPQPVVYDTESAVIRTEAKLGRLLGGVSVLEQVLYLPERQLEPGRDGLALAKKDAVTTKLKEMGLQYGTDPGDFMGHYHDDAEFNYFVAFHNLGRINGPRNWAVLLSKRYEKRNQNNDVVGREFEILGFSGKAKKPQIEKLDLVPPMTIDKFTEYRDVLRHRR